jgi:hypothetical protein
VAESSARVVILMAYESKPSDAEALQKLIDSTDVLVPAGDIAPIVGMKPDRIREYARAGQWPREVCNYVISGSHVKFFRVDFLRKGGWIT